MSEPITQLHGSVQDERGAGVAGALVSIVESSVPMPETALETDGQGCFTRGLPPGRFVLEVCLSGRSSRCAVQVEPGLARLHVVMTIPSGREIPE